MNFESDLIDIIKSQLNTDDISYNKHGDASYFAARYYEMRIRKVVPMPRIVHFSNEIHDSLGKLVEETNAEQNKKALEAWWTVFLIRDLLVKGENVTQFLSRQVNNSTYSDGILWDFGMHHFHLSKKLEKSGFVERSDYLLFAIIADSEAYFVDIRPHRDPEGLLWVRQDLLRILNSNWPELIKSYVLKGKAGDALTDKQKKELRKKNVNHVPQIGDHAIAPLGGGMMGDGSSASCRIWADKLLFEVERHQLYFDSQPVELRSELETKGIKASGSMEFKLVPLDNLNPSTELINSLRKNQCLSKDLSQMGFTIVEASTRLPIAVSIEYQEPKSSL